MLLKKILFQRKKECRYFFGQKNTKSRNFCNFQTQNRLFLDSVKISNSIFFIQQIILFFNQFGNIRIYMKKTGRRTCKIEVVKNSNANNSKIGCSDLHDIWYRRIRGVYNVKRTFNNILQILRLHSACRFVLWDLRKCRLNSNPSYKMGRTRESEDTFSAQKTQTVVIFAIFKFKITYFWTR